MLINENVLKSQVEEKPTFCKLKHPKTDQGSMFLFSPSDTDVFEVQSFNEEFRSWIIDKTICKDGKLLFTTQVDPLFLVLPYLKEAGETGKFITTEQIITDDAYPECRRLCNTTGLNQLQEIADVKGDDSFKAYRFNQDKTMAWLKKKTDRLASKLEEADICVIGSSHSSNYTKSRKGAVSTKEDYVRYAHGVISDYLSEEFSSALREYMNIPVVVSKKEIENEEPPSKRQKTEATNPTDDYSKNRTKSKATDDVKLTTAQKKLSQVDKKGMKNISSFFSPKPKVS